MIKMKKNTQRKSYFIDANRIVHFYDNCTAMVGKVKTFHDRKAWEYNICADCQQKNLTSTHEKALDLQKNEEKYIADMMGNIDKSNLSDTKKIETAIRGILAIRLITIFYSALDDMIPPPKKNDR